MKEKLTKEDYITIQEALQSGIEILELNLSNYLIDFYRTDDEFYDDMIRKTKMAIKEYKNVLKKIWVSQKKSQ